MQTKKKVKKDSRKKSKKRGKELSETHFKGKRIGILDFGSIREDDLLGGDIEVFAGSLPGCDPTPCQCSTYYT